MVQPGIRNEVEVKEHISYLISVPDIVVGNQLALSWGYFAKS
jgi:hypothetical protein